MMLPFAIFRCGSNSIIDHVSQFLISMGPIIYCSVEKKMRIRTQKYNFGLAGRSLHVFTPCLLIKVEMKMYSLIEREKRYMRIKINHQLIKNVKFSSIRCCKKNGCFIPGEIMRCHQGADSQWRNLRGTEEGATPLPPTYTINI